MHAHTPCFCRLQCLLGRRTHPSPRAASSRSSATESILPQPGRDAGCSSALPVHRLGALDNTKGHLGLFCTLGVLATAEVAQLLGTEQGGYTHTHPIPHFHLHPGIQVRAVHCVRFGSPPSPHPGLRGPGLSCIFELTFGKVPASQFVKGSSALNLPDCPLFLGAG